MSRYLDRLRLVRDLQREIQTNLLRIAEADVGVVRFLKTRQFCRQRVHAGQKAREVIGPGFVADRRLDDAGRIVRRANRYPWK